MRDKKYQNSNRVQQVKDDKWKMTSDRWQITDEWQVTDDKWQVVHSMGLRSTVSSVLKKNKVYSFILNILIALITMNFIHLCNWDKWQVTSDKMTVDRWKWKMPTGVRWQLTGNRNSYNIFYSKSTHSSKAIYVGW